MKAIRKILIVEDEAIIAMDIKVCVENNGFEVTNHISRGEDVIAELNANRPDLILMDIKLEGKADGVEIAGIIHENYNIPLIFLTSYSSSQILDRAKKTNPFGYIIKPFNERELINTIEIAFYKHETELKLRESERKYRELSESIQQIILECDLEGKINYLNQPGMQLLGLTHEEFESGVLLSDFLGGNSYELIRWRILKHSSKEAQAGNREYLLINRYGKHYFIEEYLSPVYHDGRITGFRGILFDISSRRIKRTLNTLLSNITQLFGQESANPFDIIHYLLTEFKKQFIYLEDVYFNEITEEGIIRTYRHSEITERKFFSGHTEYTFQQACPLYLRGSKLEDFNKLHSINTHGKKAVCWAGFPLEIENRIAGIFALQSFNNENALTSSDFENLVTFFNSVNSHLARLSHLKFVRKSESEYKHLVNSLSEGVVRLNLKGEVTYVNSQFNSITGYTEKEVIGKSIIKSFAIKKEARHRIQKEMFDRKQGRYSTYEIQITDKNNKEKHLLINATPFKNSEGKITGSIATVVDVTLNKENLKKIQITEQRFKAIFEQAAVGVAIVNSRTGQILEANRKYSEIFGFTKDELFNMTWKDFTFPQDIETDSRLMKMLLTEKIKEFTIEKRQYDRQGKIVWINLTVSSLWKNPEDNRNHLAIVQNITKRKEMESALLRNEIEKESILRAIPDSFVTMNNKGIIVNSYLKETEQILKGAGLEDINGKKLEVALNPGVKKILDKLYETLKSETAVTVEELKVQNENDTYFFELRFIRLTNENILIIIRNVTDYKKNLKEVAKFFNITEQTKELIMITDNNGFIEYVNPMFTEVTGYTLSEISGKQPSIFKSDKHPPSVFKDLWEDVLAGKTHKMEVLNKKKNGEYFIEQKIITPVVDEEGNITHFISTGRDVTEEKKREKKILTYQKFEKTLEKKEQKYRTLSLMQGQENERKRIARDMHDGLGQMLTVISANLQSLVTAKMSAAEKKAKTEMVNQMVSEIIQESRRISHNLSPVGLYEFGLEASVRQLINRMNVNANNIVFNYDSNLGPARFKTETEINLYRIIQEALQNSFRHSRATTIDVQINFNTSVLTLKIKDNGIGFKQGQGFSMQKNQRGLRNIEERAKIIDAKLNYVTAPGKGVKITLQLKLKQTNNG